MLAALAECERELDRRNALPRGEFAAKMASVRTLLTVGRRPRIAVVGRRSAGKSSLLNALMSRPLAAVGAVEDTTGETVRFEIEWAERTIEWMDTPGLRAGGRHLRCDHVVQTVAATPPDVMLLVCQASEVDAGIDDDLNDFRSMVAALERRWRRRPVVVGIVTKVDELAPADVIVPPFVDEEKRANIRRSVQVYGRHLRRHGLAPVTVLPVNTYATFDGGVVRDDLRWNVDTLRARLGALLPSDSWLFANALPTELQRTLRDVVTGISDSFAALAASMVMTSTNAAMEHRDLAALRAAYSRIVRALVPDRERGLRAAAVLEGVAGSGGLFDRLQGMLGRTGNRKLAAMMEATRIRALGAWIQREISLDRPAVERWFTTSNEPS